MAKKNKHALSGVEGTVERMEDKDGVPLPRVGTSEVEGTTASQELGVVSQDIDEGRVTPDTEPQAAPPQFRYVGKTIKHFEHDGKSYQLTPNSVINLPDCEQVKRLMAAGELTPTL